MKFPISIPSIIFGSAIKKGTVDLKLLHVILIGRAQDIRKNGELFQLWDVSGSVIGTVLYNEGFILITGSGSVGT